MALRLTYTSLRLPIFPNCQPSSKKSAPISQLVFLLRRPRALAPASYRRRSGGAARASPPQQQQQMEAKGGEWGKVSAVLFDMDGVLCNSEEPSRMAAVDVFAEMGVSVTVDDFVPFMGTGEANFLGGVASVKGVKGFDPEAAKRRFFEIYLDKYAKPNSGIGFPGALELIMECKRNGLKIAVASSADRIKVDANLAAAGLPASLFDAIVSADAFENLKPAPDIFIAASKILNVEPSQCIVIEDALAGVQAAKAAEMRCVAVTTTLTIESLQQGNPSLIRKDIGNVSINDILYGGSSVRPLNGKIGTEFVHEISSANQKRHFLGGMQGSRREILRYGSLGIAVSCLLFTISNWKAMQYASPRGLLNYLTGAGHSIFSQNEARNNFDVETETANAVDIEPSMGNLNPDGSATFYFKRGSSLPAMGRINCKVYYCKEEDVCLYQSVSFDVSFLQEEPGSSPADIRVPYAVKPKVTSCTSQLILANKNSK